MQALQTPPSKRHEIDGDVFSGFTLSEHPEKPDDIVGLELEGLALPFGRRRDVAHGTIGQKNDSDRSQSIGFRLYEPGEIAGVGICRLEAGGQTIHTGARKPERPFQCLRNVRRGYPRRIAITGIKCCEKIQSSTLLVIGIAIYAVGNIATTSVLEMPRLIDREGRVEVPSFLETLKDHRREDVHRERFCSRNALLDLGDENLKKIHCRVISHPVPPD
nr:hypothetical protein [Sinorhizobium meliloti]